MVAKVSGCSRIMLLTDQTNQAAQRLYRRHGVEGSSMIPLRLDLPNHSSQSDE